MGEEEAIPEYEDDARALCSLAAQDVERLRDEGNSHFRDGDLKQALFCYTQGIDNSAGLGIYRDEEMLSVLLRNRAAVYLKQDKFEKAEQDCTAALQFDMDDSKALYRRALAREKLENFGGAFKDAQAALKLEPKNETILELLRRLRETNAKMMDEAMSTVSQVQKSIRAAFDSRANDKFGNTWIQSAENRITALNNLVALSRGNPTAAELIWQEDVVSKLMNTVHKENDMEVVLAAVRVLDELAKDKTIAHNLYEKLGAKEIVALMYTRGPSAAAVSDAAAVFVQRFFNAFADMDAMKKRKADFDTAEKNKMLIIKMIIALEDVLTDPKVYAAAREAAVDLLLKNLMHMDGGLPRGWSWRFVEDRGLEKLLELACQIPEQTDFPVSAETRQHVAICLHRLYEDMVFDTKRTIYQQKCQTFLDDKLAKAENMTVRVQVCALLTTMLQGPVDIGFNLVTNNQVTELMLSMATSAHVLHQAVAVELIVEACSKRERATAIMAQGQEILKKLYTSKNEDIQARALMGLCKCAASGGDDASRQLMADGSSLRLAKSCTKFLNDAEKTLDIRRFALEGLAYLSLDADVKEWLADNRDVIRSLVYVAKEAGAICVYALSTILVNLTNTYDKPKTEPELKKLAEFAKHHVPTEHAKDADSFVKRRTAVLVKEGAVAAAVAVSKTESHSCRELLARCLSAFTLDSAHRGIVVKEGGAKLLVQLACEGTDEGRAAAAQGLARIAISLNPEIAFPGQRCYEVVRPLLDLLHVEKTCLQNYEALLALTNLASVSDSVRNRILKEKGLAKIEEYWFDQQHPELRGAAAELLLNIVHCEEGARLMTTAGNDRLKLWALYAADEDERLAKASAAGLSILTQDAAACKRITEEVKSWIDLFKEMCIREDAELQFRGMLALANMIEADKAIAAELIASEVFQYLIAISKMEDPTRKRAKEIAKRCLVAAEKFELIKPTSRELYEKMSNTSTVKTD